MSLTSTLTTNKNTKSLKTTIPLSYVDLMELKYHDELNWDIYIEKKGSLFLKVTKGKFKEILLTKNDKAKLKDVGIDIDKNCTYYDYKELSNNQISALKEVGIAPDKGVWLITPPGGKDSESNFSKPHNEPVKLSMTYTSTITKASKTEKNLRTIIPTAFIQLLDLQPGQTLEWDIHLDENKTYFLTIKKGEYYDVLPEDLDETYKLRKSVTEKIHPELRITESFIVKTEKPLKVRLSEDLKKMIDKNPKLFEEMIEKNKAKRIKSKEKRLMSFATLNDSG